MVRFRILASAVPLAFVALFARGELLPGPHPCIAIDGASVQIATMPWQAQLQVSFTTNPALATVRVQVADTAEADACEAGAAILSVDLSARPSASAPVIYLSADGPADYRIFVRSRTFTARDAAALVVGAGGGHRRLVAAAL